MRLSMRGVNRMPAAAGIVRTKLALSSASFLSRALMPASVACAVFNRCSNPFPRFGGYAGRPCQFPNGAKPKIGLFFCEGKDQLRAVTLGLRLAVIDLPFVGRGIAIIQISRCQL
jgi:hypothetical protein